MPRYKYKAFTDEGNTLEDFLVANTVAEARKQLEFSGLFVADIRLSLFSGGVSGRVPRKVFSGFNKELIALTRSGIPLTEALVLCLPRPDSEMFTNVLGSVVKKVTEGDSYSQACSSFSEAFDQIYVAAVKTGEQSGDLLTALEEYQSYLSRLEKTTTEIKRALYYPAFLFTSVAVVLAILFVFVVPAFSGLYDSLDAELPFVTQIVLGIAGVAPFVVSALIIIILFFILYLRSPNKSTESWLRVDSFLISVPIFGSIRKDIQISRSLRMLAGLVSAGTTLLTALKIIADANVRNVTGTILKRVATEVETGEKFSIALSRNKLLLPKLTRMVESGETSGALGEMLGEAAYYLEEKIDSRLLGLSSIFEPAIMLILGLIVGMVIISMYLPIFFLAEVVH